MVWRTGMVLLFVLAGALIPGTPIFAQKSSIKLAVVGVQNPSTFDKSNIGNSLVDQLTTEIDAVGKYKLVERAELQALRSELNLGQSGIADAKTFAQKGGLTGADFLLFGKISEYRYEETSSQTTQFVPGVGTQAVVMYDHVGHVRVDLRLADVKTGEVAKSFSGEGRADVTGGTSWQAQWGYYVASEGERSYADLQTLLTQAASRAIQRAVSQLDDAYDTLAMLRAKGVVSSEISSVGSGKILASLGQGKYVIGIQSTANLKIGDRFEVISETPIKNSEGVVVYREKRTVATLQISDISEETRAMAQLVNAPETAATAAQFGEGDILVFDEGYGKSLRGMPTAVSAGVPAGADTAAGATAAVQSYLQHGDRFLSNQEYSEALDQYREGLALEPNNATLLSRKSVAELGISDFTDAEDDAEKAIDSGGSVSVPIFHNHGFSFADCEGPLVISKGKVTFQLTRTNDGFTVVSKRQVAVSQAMYEGTNLPELVVRWTGDNNKEHKYDVIITMYMARVNRRAMLPLFQFYQPNSDAADKMARLDAMIVRLIDASLH